MLFGLWLTLAKESINKTRVTNSCLSVLLITKKTFTGEKKNSLS